MNISDVEYATLNELLENLSNERISSKKMFCRVFHDLAILTNSYDKDCPNILIAGIEDIQKFYKKMYWRNYYFYLFSFIYFDFKQEGFHEVEKTFRNNLENEDIGDIDDVIEELEEYELEVREHNSNLKKTDKKYMDDYLLFRMHFLTLAIYKAFIDSFKEYSILCSSSSNFKEVLDIKLLEKKLDIRKHETVQNNRIVMMYLTYSRASNKSHTTRVRNYQTAVLKQQKRTHQFSNDMARIVMSNYYQMKHYDSKLKVDDFLKSEGACSTKKRTFFKYKKYYDMRFGKNCWDKNTEEKAYEKYLIELEKNPNLVIDVELCKRINVGQKALKRQIKKEDEKI